MPYEIVYQESEGIVVTKYFGVLTDAEFRECATEKFSNRDAIRSYRYSLSDFTGLTKFEVSAEAVKKNAIASKQALEENPHGFMVVVAPDDFVFGMGRLWGGRTENELDRVKIFRTRDEADAWIESRLTTNS